MAEKDLKKNENHLRRLQGMSLCSHLVGKVVLRQGRMDCSCLTKWFREIQEFKVLKLIHPNELIPGLRILVRALSVK